MDQNLYLVIFFVAAMAFGVLISALLGRSMRKRSDQMEKPQEEKAPLDLFRESGNAREFRQADLVLPEEDFFQQEMTEQESLEEALEGLSEASLQDVMRDLQAEEQDDQSSK